MFTKLYLNDSFMIRKIIVAAVPAALLATTAALSTTAPANAQFGGAHGGALLTSGSFTMMAADSFEQGFSVEGGPNDPAQYVEQQMQQTPVEPIADEQPPHLAVKNGFVILGAEQMQHANRRAKQNVGFASHVILWTRQRLKGPAVDANFSDEYGAAERTCRPAKDGAPRRGRGVQLHDNIARAQRAR